MIELVLVPAGPARCKALLGSVAIAKPTAKPFYDGARALLALGCDPAETVTARHAGSEIVAMRSTVGEAARWTVEESDRGGLRKRLWMPRSSWEGAPETADAVEDGQMPLPASAPALGEAA